MLVRRASHALTYAQSELAGEQHADRLHVVGARTGHSELLNGRVLKWVARCKELALREAVFKRGVLAHKGADAGELGNGVEKHLIENDCGKGRNARHILGAPIEGAITSVSHHAQA